MALSFSETKDLLQDAIQATAGDSYIYIVDVYPDSVIYQLNDDYFKRSYAVTDGKVTLGDAVAVERQVSYVPLQAAGKMLAAVGNPGDEDYGYKWRVQIVEYGMGKDGRINWPAEPIRAAIPLYEGSRVFALNDSQHQDPKKANAFGKSVREIVGWLTNVSDNGNGLEGDLNILKAAKWLRDMLVDSFERGKTDLLGLSHDVIATSIDKMVAGKKVKEPVEIKSVEVDVVYDPTNNGKFLRMAAAMASEESGVRSQELNKKTEEEEMKVKLLAALQARRPDLFAKVDKDKLTEDELLNLLAASPSGSGQEGLDERIQAAVSKALEGKTSQGESAEAKEVKLLAAGMRLDRELSDSKLPEPVQSKLRKQFEGKVFEAETLQAAIKLEKETLDALNASGMVTGSGDVKVIRESGEKLQAACDKMLGVKVADSFSDVKPLESIRAAYVAMTGDTEVRGFIDDPAKLRRMQAAFDSTTFSYVLGNTLYRRLVQDYREISDYGLSRLISTKRNAKDFRPLQSVRIAYFGDIPDVNPQALDYADLGTLSDEKIEYTLNQKGGIITITRQMIINDDMSAIQKILNRLPRAARRTVAKRVWNLFINNATYKGDNKAVFHTDHGNLGSAAYAIASALAGETAMELQTEPGSNERLMLRPVTVAFPSQLFGIVSNVNTYQPQAVTVDNANAMFNFFKSEGIIECPFMTDATDWMMFADPNEVEIVEIAYLNGQETPEMFVADNPAVGQFFVGDKMQYKLRHEYEADIVDFRGAYKAVVAG